MSLTNLPTELLFMIVRYCDSPDDLESMVLSCKRLYAVCFDRIPRHNMLRKKFRKFSYFDHDPRRVGSLVESSSPEFSYPLYAAFDLLVLISMHPDVALHIKEADFSRDGQSSDFPISGRVQNTSEREAVEKLVASSPYAKEIPNWGSYCRPMRKIGYSEHATVFLLSLLPNVKILKLPDRWGSCTLMSADLLRKIIHQSRLGNDMSLSQVTELTVRDNPQPPHPLLPTESADATRRLLTLPKLRCFKVTSQRVRRPTRMIRNNMALVPAQNVPVPARDRSGIEELFLKNNGMTSVEIRSFLRPFKALTKLTLHFYRPYQILSHSSLWDICPIIQEIGLMVGGHLKELVLFQERVSHWTSHKSRKTVSRKNPLLPGKANFSWFHELESLQVPLDLVDNHRRAQGHGQHALLFRSLVPLTVKRLGFSTMGSKEEIQALEILYKGFQETPNSSLLEFHLAFSEYGDNAYEERFAGLCRDFQSAGVRLSREVITEHGVSFHERDFRRPDGWFR